MFNTQALSNCRFFLDFKCYSLIKKFPPFTRLLTKLCFKECRLQVASLQLLTMYILQFACVLDKTLILFIHFLQWESRGGALMLDSRETTMGRSPSVAFSPGSTLDGPSKEVKPFIKDPHKDAQALGNGLSKKRATVPSSTGEISCQAPKCKGRGNNNKTGVDKQAKGEEKKVTFEVPLHQSNSGEGKKVKEPSSRKVVDPNTQTGSAKKRGKRKQALDDPTACGSTTVTSTGKSRNEVPAKELKKRPRRDDRKPGESISLAEAWTSGANGSSPEELARTLYEEKGFDLEAHSWHITSFSKRAGVKVMTVEFNIEPAQKKPGRNSRKDSGKKRVKSISSGCSRVG